MCAFRAENPVSEPWEMMKDHFNIHRCTVAGVEAVEARTRHAFPRHIHDQFGIGVMIHGAQRSLSGHGIVEAGSGDTITVNPGEVHDGAPLGGIARAWKILYFSPALVAERALDITEGKTGGYECASPVIRTPRIGQRIHRLFSILTVGDGNASPMYREELLLTILAEIWGERGDEARKRKAPDAVLAARMLIDDDPAAPITLADLAQVTGLSQFQVLRGFARMTGLTPHAYLVQRRVHLARGLIARGTPLSETAATCGFADQSHMTRIFTRNFGISPGAYASAMS